MPGHRTPVKTKTAKGRLLKRASTRTPSATKRRDHRKTTSANPKGKKPASGPTKQRLSLIAQMTGAIVGSQPLRQQVKQMAQQVCSVFGADACVIRLLEGEELVLLASAGIPKKNLYPRLPSDAGLGGKIVSRRQPLFAPKAALLPNRLPVINRLHPYRFTSYAGTPLIAKDRVMGILGIYWVHEIREFGDADMDCLQILGNSIAKAIVNDGLYKEVKCQRDQLKSETVKLRRAKASLRESEQRFQSAFDYAAIGKVLVTPQGQFLKANHSMCEIVGYSEEELLTKTFQDITHPDDLQADLAHVQQMLSGEIRTYQMEKRYFHKLGHVVWVLLSVSMVRDGQGAPLYFISQIQDITDRKRAEKALKESEERFRAIMENSVDAAYRRNLQTDRFDYISPVIEQIMGFSAEEMLQFGQNEVLGRIHPDDLPMVQQALERLSGGGSATVESRFKCKDGQYRWQANAFRIVTDEQGRPTYRVGVFRDINTRKKVEEEREQLQAQLRHAQKMEAVGRLSGGIAHDFNNLLTVIHGYAELAAITLQANMTKGDVAGVTTALQEIGQAAERASKLTGQLLTFSRKHVSHIHVLDMSAVVCDMEKMLRRLIREDVAFEIARSPGEHLIQADRDQIEQVLVNLVVNASDAMPDGGKLTIQVSEATLGEAYAKKHVDAKTGPHVLITVTDTGFGMAPDTLDHLFEPFFTTKPFGEGTGLGLSIVYGIVKNSGGHITVESQPGKGSTFKLYIPATEGDISKPGEPAAPEWEGGNETILLCEDEASLRRLAASVLKESGYTIIEAENGEQAVQLAADHRGAFQLLITDMVMPGMKGDKVAAAILNDQPDVQVLFMSGYASDVLGVEKALEMKAEFLQKPFIPQVLLRRVREILNKTKR